MPIKNKLLEIRLQMGYKKQKDFAEFLGMSTYQYNRYEKNAVQPSVEILYRIAKKVNKSMEYIIYEEVSNE